MRQQFRTPTGPLMWNHASSRISQGPERRVEHFARSEGAWTLTEAAGNETIALSTLAIAVPLDEV